VGKHDFPEGKCNFPSTWHRQTGGNRLKMKLLGQKRGKTRF
jgi:hypothetical protein